MYRVISIIFNIDKRLIIDITNGPINITNGPIKLAMGKHKIGTVSVRLYTSDAQSRLESILWLFA